MNAAVETGKIMLKLFVALLKGIWYILTFGFRMYKQHQNKKLQAGQ